MPTKTLSLMISSRSDKYEIDDGAGSKIALREARQRLKAELERATYLGGKLVEVWINEEETGDHDQTAWDECLKQAEECDLFISLYDGSAGWSVTGGSVGICQAEFDTALRVAPAKVKVLRLPGAMLRSGPDRQRDERYLEALTKASRFEVHVKEDWPELRDKFLLTLRNMVLKAAQEGVREYRRSGANTGQALDWSRMSFADRSAAISTTIADALKGRGGRRVMSRVATVTALSANGSELMFACHGAPRSLSVSASREMVGQPFLRDHEIARHAESGVAGPIHLIGCPKGVTESQAVNLLGFPDFTVVEGSFGVYAADTTQKIQLCLLADCADAGSTRNSVERFLEWLARSGEIDLLIERAGSRRRIIDAVLAEAGTSRTRTT